MPPTQKVVPRRVSSRLQSKAGGKANEEKPRPGIFRVLVYAQVESDADVINVLDQNGKVRRDFT